MLSTWQSSFYKLFKSSALWSIQTEFQVCRCISTSLPLEKKQKKKPPKDESNVEYLKKEAPFLYKVVKQSANLQNKKIGGKEFLKGEVPLVFQAIKVTSTDLLDDHSDIYKELKMQSAKKETVFIIQPNFKWGRERFLTKLTDNRLSEAQALIDSVHSWEVHSSCIESVHDNSKKFFFGSGKVIDLAERIRHLINENGVTMVFLNTSRLSLRQIKELESAWGCKVFDRYRVVLELFKERANTSEAKLQVQLAEIQYLKTHLSSGDLHYDQQRGGGKGRFGKGETQLEIMKRTLSDAESKIKKSLLHIKSQRSMVKAERIKKRIPQVALIGYTNAGKTTLAKTLSQDAKLAPENKLFATLDTTAHRGKLPSGLNLVYIDTVGFISELPHELVESFSTTLEDVKTADLVIHVSDISHPEFELQKDTVEKVLDTLHLPDELRQNMLHVLNKVDLRDTNAVKTTHVVSLEVSATMGNGVEQLRQLIEEKILKSTGRQTLKINIDQRRNELSWLYRHGTVLDTIAHDDGSLDIIAILDEANKNKFEKEFHVKLKH